ncbi:UDP-glycosyltransferase UGT5-like [Nymphalis io]|uniref:UDP-glycosyltransferase UGT5-like n=1 Tax=Inachis io TaxID=171585 RepID=UPI002169188C|nr:UDP-glycosyltransferase UGT5-like [Nymphalis io]
MKMLKVIVSLVCMFVGSETAKILGVFPTPSISHQVVFRPLMLELARRGHELTVITTDPAYPKGQAPQNLTEIDLHDISYNHWKIFTERENEEDPIEFFRFANIFLFELFLKQLKSTEIQKLLHDNRKFDLLFIESCIRPAFSFSYIYDVPVIEISSFSGVLSAYEMIGAASHPLIYPNAMHRRIYNLTLWEKVTELYIHYSNENVYKNHEKTENKILKSILGADMPDLHDLKQKVRMLFLNVHPIWDFNRPVPPNVLYLGGLHQNPQLELPEDLKSYLDSSKFGVIYMSFGTNVKPSMLPSESLKIFTNVFSQLPYDILLKWDKDELPGRPSNVKISKWLPQSDLLRHPKVKLFITQGGLQSTDEALTAGVPLVGIPILGDQWFNVEQYVKFNIGKGLLIDTLTEKQLIDAINTVIKDPSYRQNIVKLRNFMNDQPQSPLERAVWWTEHVLRHSDVEYRRTPAANIPWTEYYEVKIVLLMSKIFKVIVSLMYVIIEIKTAKILGVFPVPSISHQDVFRPLMLELSKRGHEVTVVTTNPVFPKGQSPQNFSEIDVHDITYERWSVFFADKGNEKDRTKLFYFISELLLDLFVIQLKSPAVQNLIRSNERFDLIFVESCVRPTLIFSHIYNAPVIEFSSLGGVLSAFETIGAATHPIIYPNAMHRRIYNLSLWEKITELYIHYMNEHIFTKHVETENEILKSILGPDIPDLNDLRQNVQMMFLNVHPIWDFNRPVPPNVLYLRGLHQKLQHELPEDIKSYLDSSTHGVIYMSFGSNVMPSKLPSDKLKIFTNVFSQLPYDILWKWDKDELPARPTNVKISKWLPQSDLLRHPKIKLFITQGGLQSTDEALSAGVPLIGIPMLSDQWFNVEQYVKFNIGKLTLIETLTEEQLMDAITTIINDPSYRQNVVKLNSFMNDQPQSSLERAVWWTEHVLRHGEVAYRRTPAANIRWADYYELKIVLILLFTLIVLLSFKILAIYLIVLFIQSYMRLKVKKS